MENATSSFVDGNETSAAKANGSVNVTLNEFHFYKTEQLIFLVFLFIVIFIGNVAVLVAVTLTRRRKSRMNFFIMNVAVADLLNGIFYVLTDIIWKTTESWYAGDVMCKLVKYLQGVFAFASTYMLVAMSMDRVDAIARPMHFSGSWTRVKILAVGAWTLPLALSAPFLFYSEETMFQAGPQCWVDLPLLSHWQLYLTINAVLIFFIPAIVILICYAVIISIIWRSSDVGVKSTSKANEKLTGSDKHSSHSSSRGVIPQAKIRTVKMTFFIVTAFIVCWSPYFIWDLLQVFGHIKKTQTSIAVSTFLQSFAPLNSAANPIIYGIFTTRICRYLRKYEAFDRLASVLCCCCEKDLAKPTRHTISTTMTEYTSMTETETTRMRPVYKSSPIPNRVMLSNNSAETEPLA